MPVDRLLPVVAGNPGYAGEYVRTLADRRRAGWWLGDGEPPMPERVRGIASARLSGVAWPDRAVLHAAAVLGEPVWPDAVAALVCVEAASVDAALCRLESRGLLVRRASTVADGGSEYAFADPVLQRVAYGQLPRAVRVEHHRRAAQWLATAAGGQGHRVEQERLRHRLAASDLARALQRRSRAYLAAAGTALTVTARRAMGLPTAPPGDGAPPSGRCGPDGQRPCPPDRVPAAV
jgi:predicted ATPase